MAVATSVMVAFGVILYGFSIFVTDTAAGADFSKTTLSIAYGGSVVVGGLLAVPVGAWADRHGIRQILVLGGALAGAGMAAFAVAEKPWQVVLAWWLLLGPASAMLFYEVAFVAIDQWSLPGDVPRALGAVTLIGGLAGIIFIPGTEWLVGTIEWRPTAAVLGATVAATSWLTALAALRGLQRPPPPTAQPRRRGLLRSLVGDSRFIIHTIAMVLVFFAVQGLFAHRVAVFDEQGFDLGLVAIWAAVASALSLPGRWVAPLVATRMRPSDLQAATAAVLAVGTLLMLDGSRGWQMAGHFILFGLAFGAFLPLRAMTMSEWFSGSGYGTTMGSQWTVVTIAGAIGPIVAGYLRDTSGDYTATVWALATALVVAVGLLVATTRLVGPADG